MKAAWIEAVQVFQVFNDPRLSMAETKIRLENHRQAFTCGLVGCAKNNCLRLGLIGLLIFSGRTMAAVSDVNFSESAYYSNSIANFAATGMAWAPDGSGRLFVTRKGGFSNGTGTGEVRIIQNGTILTTPFATESVFTNSECGLIGITFDPGFASNGFVYLFATVSNSQQQIIRYTASGNTGTNRTVLVPNLPTVGNNHDGGGIGIGRDGKLYWAVGDQGNRTGVDLNASTLAAKAGRANRDGSVPNDNPLFDGVGGNNDYIFAGGLRNPFTLTFQPGTGALWINVVGDGYEQVFIVGSGENAGYDNVENGVPAGSASPYAGYITPVIKYRTNGTDSRNLAASGASRSGNVVTATTTSSHGFRRGERITLAGVTDSSFNGSFYITGTPTATTFTYAQTGTDATSGSGTATTLNLGGSITGGTFLDTTSVPLAYRGNFFFGDYNSGRVMRSTLTPNNNVTSVDYFGSGITNIVDTSVGPDGALYGLRIDGNVVRWAFTQTTQGLIVTPTQLQTDEGALAAFSVRLAIAPASNSTVTVARTSGDTDLTVSSGATLTFTPSNWATPQTVMLNAAEDADATSDTANFTVSSSGLTSEEVTLFALDNDTPEIAVSNSALAVNEGASNSFSVTLTGPPSGIAVLAVARTSGDSDISVSGGSVLTFNSSNFSTPQNVTITAAEDADVVNDSAVITLSGSGFASRTVNVTVSDNDTVAPLITTSPVTTAVINARYIYDVDATGNPAPTFSLPVFPSGMTVGGNTGIIEWVPTTLGASDVTVMAANSTLPASAQIFTINVVPDQPPTAVLTRPYEGEFVFGTDAEFFGDGDDDVGTVKGEFFIDDILSYTDTTLGEHYHIGGTHNQWNSTLLTNGAHVVRMTVFDTSGQSGSVSRNVIVANGVSRWQAWRLAKFTAPERADSNFSGENADSDGDTFNTLLEYALSGNPKSPDNLAPVLGTDNGRLTITFTRVLGATDLTYTPQATSDLVSPWSAAGFTLINTVTTGATERVTYRDDAILPPEATRFLRLLVAKTGM
jgi:glucose/arabinose dehydrogenase